MAAETTPRRSREEQAEQTPASASRPTFFGAIGRLVRRPAISATLAVVAILVFAGLMVYVFRGLPADSAKPAPEVALGDFRFQGRGESDAAVSARFELHITLLEKNEEAARQQLTARKYRVQQDIEQLLRQAHGSDFDDPTLVGLKRQMQEQINLTLGMRAVSEIILTSVRIERPAGSITGKLAETSSGGGLHGPNGH